MSDTESRQQEKATFAGGCFWCMEHPFAALDGVVSVTVGYAGGDRENPTYEEVCAGGTGHAEAVEVLFDPGRIGYDELLEVFWRNIDPTAVNRQFADMGSQYRTAIFFHDEEQRRLAEASKRALQDSGLFAAPIATEISPAGPFYRAEDYHQGYYRKNPVRYGLYRSGSGRDRFLDRTWEKERKKE
ncbi:MAG: peptide-methionine (S)-S-oxide reductase [Desulfuromonas sp.]|uniref:peptide-methionine (S)-S-oxide reductase MsrA n=1 Tax=Desulfuromonas sp. TaxID=892 RepID=UPI000CB05437|nr:peptide-methionine (S)-S-oxide reductase MsrA [Desulfuromonas sp.]PLX84859.1 MAG: peptide-methionine (S)-S-oxide reductase [Desulfuromonas sp.]